MSMKLLVQGLESDNHLDAIVSVLQLPKITGAVLSVAFVRTAGVINILDLLRGLGKKATIYAGIRNGITSAQALKMLLDSGVNVYTVDTGTVNKIFHPKLYFAKSKNSSRLLVGSANLTAGGLSSNIEVSLALDLDMNNKDHSYLADSVSATFADMVSKHPRNVEKLSSKRSLDDLLLDLRLSDETIAPRPVAVSSSKVGLAKTPVMKLNQKPIRVPKPATGSIGKIPSKSAPAVTTFLMPANSYERVWRTENLTERDLNVPTGSNTKATGSMNLDKGDLLGDYEWADFFRNKVFQKLSWSPVDSKKNQFAFGVFRLVIGGIDYGEYTLKVRHDTKTNTRSYQQRNAMTKLSWGDIKPLVAQKHLIGRAFVLSKQVGSPDHFMIEID